MKRFLAPLLVSTLFTTVNAKAWQTPFSSDIHFGGGISKFSSKETTDTVSQTTWSAGADLDWRMNEWLSFQPGIQFSKESNFGFVTLPALTKLTTSIGDTELFVFIGPYLSITTARPSPEMRGIDFGSFQGIGCSVPLDNRLAVSFDIRYKIGAMDLDPSDTVSLRSRSLQLNLGLSFPL